MLTACFQPEYPLQEPPGLGRCPGGHSGVGVDENLSVATLRQTGRQSLPDTWRTPQELRGVSSV